MSLNKLVGADCGGNNTLVQLSSIVSRDGSLAHSSSQSDRYVNEFMAQNMQGPQSFNMNALLNTVHEIDQPNLQNNKPWINDSAIRHNVNATPVNWSHRQSFMPPQQIMQHYPPNSMLSLPSHRPPSNIQIQYLNESEMETDSVREKAQEYVNSVDNDELAYNQFMSFMKKVSGAQINLTDNVEQEETTKMNQDEILNEMAEKYKDEWAKLSDITDFWQTDTANGIPKEYTFTEGNIMLENKSALEIGKEKLKMGDIPGAALCFEAAVQQQPDFAEAWFLLGTTQAENEQDPLAVAALKKSLEINPTQLDAYMTLAAAYTNENMSKYAFLSLYDWLKANPSYADLLPQDIQPQTLDKMELESHVRSLYLKAAQLNPLHVDPGVQTALGVFFNITQEYDKAIDCFKTALMVANQDSKLWNRLGATLANSDRSEEAVDAYHEALNLEPGFIRARYNVGITCMNLGAHRQAAEHFLVALNQQNKAKNLYPEASSVDNSSSTIWSTLRMVCAFMGEHQVARLVDERNLAEINRFFEVE